MNDSDQGDFINTLAMSQQEHCVILIILICADEGTPEQTGNYITNFYILA